MQRVCTTLMPSTHASLPIKMYTIWHRRFQTMPACLGCQGHIDDTSSICPWLSRYRSSGVVVGWFCSHPSPTFHELFWLQPAPGGCRTCSKNLYRFSILSNLPQSQLCHRPCYLAAMSQNHETISSQPSKKGIVDCKYLIYVIGQRGYGTGKIANGHGMVYIYMVGYAWYGIVVC